MNGDIFPIKNFGLTPTDSFRIRLNFYLLDSGWVRLRTRESYLDTLSGFLITLRMQPHSMLYLNKILPALSSVKLQSGYLDTLTMRAVGQDYLSLGEMRMYYHDLKVQFLKNGKEEKKSVAGVATAVAFACGMLIYIIMLIYGTMVMRGVMEEKISRIAEVMVSSVKPFQLMMGKIIGIGAVGLTQFAIWIVLIVGLQLLLPLFFPAFDMSALPQPGQVPGGVAESTSMFATMRTGLHSVPWGLIIFCFIFYFIGGYLLYASLFAAIGSVVSEDQNEAQSMVFPVMMPIVLGFVIMTRAIAEPNSPLAIFGSIFPLTSPVVMMGRIMYNVPVSQLIISMLLLILGFLFFAWLTAKIYRTGILLYGKKVTWKEMIRWAFRKA
jgi:ABC-2 type transport system permease protein